MPYKSCLERDLNQNMKKCYQKVDIQQSDHIPTIYLPTATSAMGTATPRKFLTKTQIKKESTV